jgi:hypothetical protein
MSEGHGNPWTPAGNVGQPAPTAPVAPVARRRAVDGSSMAAIAIVLAVGLLLLGAIVTGLSLEDTGDEGWKLTVKILGLSNVTALGFSGSGALMAAVALLVAYALAQTSASGRVAVGAGMALLGGYLLVVVLIGIYVDIDALSNADQSEGVIAGGLIGDLGAAVAAAAATFSGVRLLSPR